MSVQKIAAWIPVTDDLVDVEGRALLAQPGPRLSLNLGTFVLFGMEPRWRDRLERPWLYPTLARFPDIELFPRLTPWFQRGGRLRGALREACIEIRSAW